MADGDLDILNSTTIYANEFWGNLILHFGMEPLGIIHNYNGYKARLKLEHAL